MQWNVSRPSHIIFLLQRKEGCTTFFLSVIFAKGGGDVGDCVVLKVCGDEGVVLYIFLCGFILVGLLMISQWKIDVNVKCEVCSKVCSKVMMIQEEEERKSKLNMMK